MEGSEDVAHVVTTQAIDGRQHVPSQGGELEPKSVSDAEGAAAIRRAVSPIEIVAAAARSQSFRATRP